jgi:hypothetical protein
MLRLVANVATKRSTSACWSARARSAHTASHALPRAVRIRSSPITTRSTVWTTPTAAESTARGMALISRPAERSAVVISTPASCDPV